MANGDRKKSKFKYKQLQQETELSPPGREQQLPLGVWDCCLKPKELAKYEYAYGSLYITDGGVLSAPTTGARSPRVSLLRQCPNTLSLLNPIPIPDPILRICRVRLKTENLHLELAVGKQTRKPFSGPKCNHRCETAARLGGSFGFRTASAPFLSPPLCLFGSISLALPGWFLFCQCSFYFSLILCVFFCCVCCFAVARISDSSCISSHLDGRAPAARMLNMHFHFNIKI